MTEKFDEILDKCIDSINSGDSIDECLARYPEHAAELMPLLRTVTGAHSAVPFTPSAEKKQAARQQMLELMESPGGKEKHPFLAGFFRKTKVWASAAAFAVVALISVFGIMPLLNNEVENNFALMISDEATIVDYFKTIEVELGTVKLYHSTEGWQEITPIVTTVDLTDIKGELAQKIWEGELLVGQYTKVSIEIKSIYAVLILGDIEATINFSATLEVNVGFEINADSLTNYVYDMTVTGIPSDYGLTPVEGESGPEQPFDLIQAP